MRGDLSKVFEYNAEYAQNVADERNRNWGRVPNGITDSKLSRELRTLIVGKNCSPYSAVCELNQKGWPSESRACEKTVYNWVNGGLIYGVARTDLPNKGVKYREKGSKRRFSRAECAAHSIDTRPKVVESRETFGHWELDTVKGGKDTSTACLFAMTERKSRMEIAGLIPDAKAGSVWAFLNRLEQEMGSEAFRRTFVTMTCDG